MKSSIVPLHQVLELDIDAVSIEPSESYKIAGVYSFGRGLFSRSPLLGSETTYKTFHRLHKNSFVLSQLKGWEGALSLVSEEFDGYFLSPQFPTFSAIDNCLDIEYFSWYCKQSKIWESLRQKSQGMGARRDSVSVKKFLSLEIPLPPIAEQRRIVARIQELAAKIEEARGLRVGAIDATNKIIGTFKQKFFSLNPRAIELGEVATIIDPNPSHRYPDYMSQGIPMISTVDFVGEDEITTKNAKYVSLDFYQETLGRFNVGEDDVIFSRKGKVGYARLHPPEIKLAMTHTLCVIQPNTQRILPKYLLYFTRSPAFISYLMGTMNPNVGVPTLGLGVIRSAPLDLPTLAEQSHVVEYLDGLQTKVDQTRYFRQNALKEFDSLLPTILDKAFKGEL
jgi:type I restriction enzyme S subunit